MHVFLTEPNVSLPKHTEHAVRLYFIGVTLVFSAISVHMFVCIAYIRDNFVWPDRYRTYLSLSLVNIESPDIHTHKLIAFHCPYPNHIYVQRFGASTISTHYNALYVHYFSGT